MESIEPISNLEFLIKIASLGAAGVSTLFVGIIGVYIIRIPNDVSALKASLVKYFMGICAFMVIVCGISSWANAHFTQTKVATANENFNKLIEAYEKEENTIETERENLQASLDDLKSSINSLPPIFSNSLRNKIQRTESGVNQLRLTSSDTLIKRIKTRPKPH